MQAGVDRVITVDLHASQIQGFFDIPVDNLYGEPIFARYVKDNMREKLGNVVIVSPDAGGVKRAKSFSDMLGCGLAIIHKERKRANEVEGMTLVGTVQDMVVLLIDDMVDTCGTIVLAAQTCVDNGAREVWALAVHGVLSDPAPRRISECAALKGVVVTNTIPHVPGRLPPKLVTLDMSMLLAEAVRRTHNGESISALFSSTVAASEALPVAPN